MNSTKAAGMMWVAAVITYTIQATIIVAISALVQVPSIVAVVMTTFLSESGLNQGFIAKPIRETHPRSPCLKPMLLNPRSAFTNCPFSSLHRQLRSHDNQPYPATLFAGV